MNKIYWLVIFILTCKAGDGQNLVPNGDFEQYTVCPASIDQLSDATFWTNPGPGSPDFMNACSAGTVNIPNCTYGYHQAYHGSGMGGVSIFSSHTANFREYLETSLSSPLIAGAVYYFEMQISAGSNGKDAADAIGVYFSNTYLTGLPDLFSFSPQIIYTGGLITDTVNWISVSGYFMANGGENYLCIGNFRNDAATNSTTLNSSATYPVAYVYVDGITLTLHTTDIGEQSNNSEIKIFPDPVTDRLYITTNNHELTEIILYDITSRLLLQDSFITTASISTGQLTTGIYLYEVKSKTGRIKKGKFVKK